MSDREFPAGPLSGLRVADFTSNIAGPYATMLMADLGAEVIKVEAPAGDAGRNWGSWRDGSRSMQFITVNRNKKSAVLDLKTEAGREVALNLIADSDVVLQAFAPGVAARLGISVDDARRVNPGVIYVSISGYGLTGVQSARLGFDSVVQGDAGIMDMNGTPESGPCRLPVAAIDYGTGMHAFGAVMAALYRKRVSGSDAGDHIDVSLYDTAITLLGTAIPEAGLTGHGPTRTGADYPYQSPYGSYQAKDRRFLLAVGSAGGWTRFCEAFGLQHLEHHPLFSTNRDRVLNRDELNRELNARFASMTADECLAIAGRAGVPASHLKTVAEVIESEGAGSRGAIQHVPLIDAEGSAPIAALGWRSELLETGFAPPPLLGEDTDEIVERYGAAQAGKGL